MDRHSLRLSVAASAIAATALTGFLAPIAAAADDFYDPPAHLHHYSRGDLIKYDEDFELDPKTPSVGAEYRIMYRSRGAIENAIAVTGVVVVPAGTPPPGGWPIVAWAHGTSGVGDDCAPSKHGTLYPLTWWDVYSVYVNDLVEEGWIVVATDYEGLGTPGPHTYLNAESEARAILDSVVATRQLVPGSSHKFAVIGHSQGAFAALRAGELGVPKGPQGKDLDFVGTVGVGVGVLSVGELTPLFAVDWIYPLLGWLALGTQATHPRFDPAELLGPTLLARLDDARELCWGEWFTSFPPPAPENLDDILNPGFLESKAYADYSAETDVGHEQSGPPVMIVNTDLDVFFTLEQMEALKDRMCSNGSTVAKLQIPTGDHDLVLPLTFTQVSAWLHDRFDGEAAPNDCD